MRGGCACRAVRYRALTPPRDVGYCHCSMCRKTSGAPVSVYGTVDRDSLVVDAGAISFRRSSPLARRGFCGRCGTPICMIYDATPDEIDLAIGTLDRPDQAPPQFHIWTEDRLGWFEIADGLPRYPRSRAG